MAEARGRNCLLAVGLVLGLSQLACDRPAFSGPGPSGPGTVVLGFDVVCPASIFVGQTGFCFALRKGTQTGLDATWASSDPSVASFGPIGSLKGRSAGQIVATATYQGRSESASVSVKAEDVLRVSSAVFQGIFKVGNTVMMGVGGFYGVASAESGLLNLVVTDQNDVSVSASEPQIVARGGDSLVISHTFTIPAGTTRLCRTAVLQIGSLTLTATGPSEIFPCVPVTQ
jgi:hypothetical protein